MQPRAAGADLLSSYPVVYSTFLLFSGNRVACSLLGYSIWTALCVLITNNFLSTIPLSVPRSISL
jgi:hypothetical protein